MCFFPIAAAMMSIVVSFGWRFDDGITMVAGGWRFGCSKRGTSSFSLGNDSVATLPYIKTHLKLK